MDGAIEPAALERAAALLADSTHTVVLAGAGMSKESGIPTFRGEGGLWTTHGEPPMNQYDGFRTDPKRWWQRRLEAAAGGDQFGAAVGAAEPNAGHYALVELERLGAVRHVITQNVDDLHRRAGQQSLTEIHGNRLWLRCVVCQARWAADAFTVDPDRLPPRCARVGCDGAVKGDTVMFGEPIPPDALESCHREAQQADAVLLVGTSAVVYPAAEFPLIAHRRGAQLIEVNPQATPLSDACVAVLRAPSGHALPKLLERVQALTPGAAPSEGRA